MFRTTQSSGVSPSSSFGSPKRRASPRVARVGLEKAWPGLASRLAFGRGGQRGRPAWEHPRGNSTLHSVAVVYFDRPIAR